MKSSASELGLLDIPRDFPNKVVSRPVSFDIVCQFVVSRSHATST